MNEVTSVQHRVLKSNDISNELVWEKEKHVFRKKIQTHIQVCLLSHEFIIYSKFIGRKTGDYQHSCLTGEGIPSE